MLYFVPKHCQKVLLGSESFQMIDASFGMKSDLRICELRDLEKTLWLLLLPFVATTMVMLVVSEFSVFDAQS